MSLEGLNRELSPTWPRSPAARRNAAAARGGVTPSRERGRMHEPILGSEAIEAGTLTRAALRWNYTALLPDVYILKDARIDTWAKAQAAWLWTGRRGVIAGRTAAALAGVEPIDPRAPIEIIAPPRRSQPGIIVRDESIDSDEIAPDTMPPRTNAARTAFDIARRLPLKEAIVILDQLAAIDAITPADVEPLQHRYQGARGTSSARDAIRMMDGGSRSPEESLLRLSLLQSYLPPPQTHIEIAEELWDATIAMGWPDARVGVEWGPHRRAVHIDVKFRHLLYERDWILIEAMPNYRVGSIVWKCWKALRRRGAVR